MAFKDKKVNAKKIAVLSVLTALGLLAFMLENLLPSLFVPGAKLGLSNLFTLFALVLYSPKEAVLLVIIRTVSGCIFSGNVSAIPYSLTAGLISVCLSSAFLCFFHGKISLVCISVFSACIHNVVQLTVFFLFVPNTAIFSYLPFLLAAGMISGLIVGILTVAVIGILPLSFFEKAVGLSFGRYKKQNIESQSRED